MINAGSAGSDAQNAAPIGISDEFRRDETETKKGSGKVECPSCDKSDSIHIDNVNGEGTYQSLKKSAQPASKN